MKIVIIAAGLVFGARAALAGVPVGRGEVTASVTTTATYDSNVFGSHLATADYSGTVTPEVAYVRKAGEIEAEVNAGVAFIRYLDHTELNANNLNADATLRVPEADLRNYSGSLSAAYRETSDINTDLNARINAATTTFTARSALVTGPRSDVSLDGTYTDTQRSLGSDQQILTTEAHYDYKDFFYGNSLRIVGTYDELHSSGDNALGVPLNQNSYLLSAGLNRGFADNALRASLSYGYRILNRAAAETSTGVERQQGSVISANLEGPFLPERYFPKITSSFTLSYQDAATPGINDTGTKELTGSLSLAWQARENTRLSFTARRSQGLSVNDLSVVSTNVQLGLEQTLRYNLTGTLTAGYDWSSYRTIAREDRTASFAAGLKYRFALAWDATFTGTVSSTTSTQLSSAVDRNVASLGVTYRF